VILYRFIAILHLTKIYKFMKKLILIGTIATLFLSSQGNAKTQGHYVGLNLINTELESKATLDGNVHDKGVADTFSVGISYKYAFNFNGFFAAPEVFYDLNKTGSRSVFSDGDVYTARLNNSYGAKLNLGYDITDKFAAFGIIGHSINRLSNGLASDGMRTNNTKEAFVYGAGIKYELCNNFSANFSYEISQFAFSSDVLNTTDKFNPNYRVAKIGLAYNF
jgi:opacity protein-like surface antigen